MGSLKTPETSPAPFPAVATLRLQLIPANTGELREDLETGAAQRLGGTLSEEVLELGTLNQKEKLRPEQICQALPAERPCKGMRNLGTQLQV